MEHSMKVSFPRPRLFTAPSSYPIQNAETRARQVIRHWRRRISLKMAGQAAGRNKPSKQIHLKMSPRPNSPATTVSDLQPNDVVLLPVARGTWPPLEAHWSALRTHVPCKCATLLSSDNVQYMPSRATYTARLTSHLREAEIGCARSYPPYWYEG